MGYGGLQTAHNASLQKSVFPITVISRKQKKRTKGTGTAKLVSNSKSFILLF